MPESENLPLGATINMDGTALYEAAAAIFIGQAYALVNPEFSLTAMSQLTIVMRSTRFCANVECPYPVGQQLGLAF